MSPGKWFICGIVGLLMAAAGSPALAQPIFENWNTAACKLTETATLNVDRPTHIDRVEVWYNWAPDETAVSYTASLDDQVVFAGDLVRGECDPIQHDWCTARDETGRDLAPGVYTLRTQRAAICQNAGSRGEGFVRAFGSHQVATPVPTAQPEQPGPEQPPFAAAPNEQAPAGSGAFVPPPSESAGAAPEGAPIEPAPTGSGTFVPSPSESAGAVPEGAPIEPAPTGSGTFVQPPSEGAQVAPESPEPQQGAAAPTESSEGVSDESCHVPSGGERSAVLDTVRGPVAGDLKQPVKFKVSSIRVCGKWAFVIAEPIKSSGEPIQWQRTVCKGDVSHLVGALEQKDQAGVWRMQEYALCPTDVAWENWPEKHGAPKALFAD